jgi:hypothetical protein
MDILVALAAFAGIMAAFATIVTVLVEGVHKFLALRSSGMREMLRAFHDSVQLPAEAQHDTASPESVEFANRIVTSPARSTRGWYLERIPILKHLVARRFVRLSTLQFVEQLAQTDIGERLAGLDRDRLRRELSAMAHRFERLGEAQFDYFKRRAKAISVLTALTVVVFANVDAIFLFKTLVRDQTLANVTIQRLESTEFEQSSARAVAQLQQLSANLDETSNAAGEVTPAQLDAVSRDVGAPHAMFQTAQASSNAFQSMGLPVGSGMFPFCGSGVAAGLRTSRLTNAAEPVTDAALGAIDPAYIDPRCASELEPIRIWGLARVDGAALPAIAEITPDPSWRRLLSWDGVLWICGLIAAAGLVGLGAPFWFELFSRLTGATAPQRAALSAEEAERQSEARGQVRNPERVDEDALLNGFEYARAPGSGTPNPPAGRRVGQSSLQMGANAVTSAQAAEESRSAAQPRRWLR